MDIFTVQLITALSLLGGNILFGALPLICVKEVGYFSSIDNEWIRKLKCATFLLYFGGGVFISDSFLVLLPQARRNFDNHEVHTHAENEDGSGQHHHRFPIPEFVVLCSFFVAYVLQEMIYFIVSKINSNARKTSDLRVRFCSCAKRHTECSRTYKDARPDQTLFGLEKKLMESGSTTHFSTAVTSGPSEALITSKSDLLRSSIITQTIPNYGTLANITEPATDSPLPVLSPPVLLTEERLAEEEESLARDRNKLLVSSILTIVSLTFQYIFLGLALGIRTASPTKWCYLVVTCLQNFMLTFSAGSDLIVGNMELTYVAIHIAVLSIISPVGVIIAMFRKNYVEEIPHIATGIVSAIACGVLLYTTFYEMLRQKKLGSVVGLTKYCAIILGAGTMAALQYAILTL